MGPLVVVLLLALWASILLPGVLRGRRASSPLDTVTDFERSMSTLSLRSDQRMPGRTVLVLEHPASVTGGSQRARVLARRRATLKGLSAAVVISALLALVLGTAGLVLFGASVAAAAGYVAILRSSAARTSEARRKTTPLFIRQRRAAPQPLRRTGT